MAKLGEILSPQQAMELALIEGGRSAGFTAPNPLVGCVVLDKNNHFLASGNHEIYGGWHAEINAFNKIPSEKIEGAKVFVTLEPCAHEGKTPSCAQTLAKLPIFSVTYGVEDPNPLVSGKGLKILKHAGKTLIHLKEYEQKCINLAEVFFVNQRKQRTFIAMKVASSLDGFIGLNNGESQWITSEEARHHGHLLRGTYDGICVGAKTFLLDNPKLNIRHPHFENKSNKVILIDERGTLVSKILDSNIGKNHNLNNIYIVQPIDKIENSISGINILPLNYKNGFLMIDLLQTLYKNGIYSILVEGGAQTYGQFLSEKLVDRLYCFIAPSLIGSDEGISWTKGLLTQELKNKLTFQRPELEFFGRDLLISTRLES